MACKVVCSLVRCHICIQTLPFDSPAGFQFCFLDAQSMSLHGPSLAGGTGTMLVALSANAFPTWP